VKKVSQVEHARKRKESFEELAAKRARRAVAKELTGSYVNILAGKLSGKVGFVSRGGNGYCIVEVWDRETQADSPLVVMKRCADLRLIGEESTSDVDSLSQSTCPSVEEQSPSLSSASQSTNQEEKTYNSPTSSSEVSDKNEDHPEIVGAASVLMHLLVRSSSPSTLSPNHNMPGDSRSEGSMLS